MPLDHLSLCTTLVVLRQDRQPLHSGTAFFYEIPLASPAESCMLCLVTACHVLTTHVPGSSEPNRGNFIDFWIHTSADKPELQRQCTLPLYTRNGQPTWLQSSTCGQADIAVLPIPAGFWRDLQGVKCLGPEWIESGLRPSIAATVAVVGYPYGLEDEVNGLPVWKTGTIASEPYVDFQGQPMFLVDVAGFKGMSGAPVVALPGGLCESESTRGARGLGRTWRLLGVYTAREEHDIDMPLRIVSQSAVPGVQYPESLQLGHVWKVSLVQEIVSTLDPVRYAAEISSRT
jgi:hypothetical protein